MDNSGKNRYELLFMDDDVSDPLDNIAKKKVKQPAAVTSVAPQTKSSLTGKQNADIPKKSAAHLSSEKENKSLAMNKNLDNKKSAGSNATSGGGGGPSAPVGKTVASKSGQQQQQLSNSHPNANRNNRDSNNEERLASPSNIDPQFLVTVYIFTPLHCSK